MHSTTLLVTARTTLRELEADDAAFIRDLLNDADFLRYIGDRGVRTVDEARDFIEQRYRQSYRDHGYGLYLVQARDSGAPLGLCGFVRRDGLEHPDLGFALMPAAAGRGLAFEAAAATLQFGVATLQLRTVLAVVQPGNARSTRLLDRLGFTRCGRVLLPTGPDLLELFRWDGPSGSAAVERPRAPR